MNHLLAMGTLGNMELLIIAVLFSPFVVILGLAVYYVREAHFKKRGPPPLPKEPPHE